MALRQVQLVVVVDDDDMDTVFDDLADIMRECEFDATVFDIFVTDELGQVERP